MLFKYTDNAIIVESDDSTVWLNMHKKIHREDGPAIITDNGKYGWYLNGGRVTKKEVLNTPAKRQKWNVEELLLKL